MRKWITLLMTLLVGCTSYANANTGQVTFEAGYRRDNISWRHKFPSNDPLVSSGTRFKDLDIFQIGIQGRSTLGCNFYVRGNAYWGWILDGDFERNVSTYFSPDYSFDNDNLKFGFTDDSKTVIDDKYVYGVSGAIGYPFYFCDCSVILAPVLGYAYDEQNIRIDDQGFNFGLSENFIFPLDEVGGRGCCRQTFISRWYGPFVGLDFNYHPWNECWNVWADVEYHWGHFRGKRSNGDGFDFFDHHNRSSRHATGWLFYAGADYDLCNQWTVGLSVKFQDWNASRHSRNNDSYSEFEGSFDNDRQRTNHKWRSWAVNLTFGRDF